MSISTVSKEIEFDAGHRVPDHGSKCRSPHGHRYRVRVTCVGTVVEEVGAADAGMVVDFGDLKGWLTEFIHDPLDHAMVIFQGDHLLLNQFGVPREVGHDMTPAGPAEVSEGDWKVYVFPFIPTAENMARWCWDQLAPVVAEHWRGNMDLALVEVWETPTSLATYVGDLSRYVATVEPC